MSPQPIARGRCGQLSTGVRRLLESPGMRSGDKPLPQGRRGHREARTRNDWLAHEHGADDSEEGSDAYDGARFGAASV